MDALHPRLWLLTVCSAAAFVLLWWWTLGRPRARRRQLLRRRLAEFDADAADPSLVAWPAALAEASAGDARHPWFLFLGDAAANVPGLLALDPGVDLFWQVRSFPAMTAIALRSDAVCDAAEPCARSLWFRALLTLAERRPALPINGIVLCVDAQSVSQSPPHAIEVLAQRLQGMLQEATQLLRLQLPAYLVITGLEKLRGHAEVLDALPPDVRAQALGHRLTEQESASGTPATRFDAVFSALLERLHALGAALLREHPDPARQLAVLGWGDQMAGLRPGLKALVERLFEAADDVRWRGLYLTAAPSGSAEAAFAADLFGRLLPADQPLARPGTGR